MKKIFIAVCFLLAGLTAQAQEPNTLTEQERKDGWELLFDGKTTKGWHTFNTKSIGKAWKVVDGALWLSPVNKTKMQVDKGVTGAPESETGGDIVTDNSYDNYEFMIDWKIEPCGNSGIIFNVVEHPEFKYVWVTGPEMQILDNDCHEDGRIPKHRAGNLYDLIASEKESVKKPGEWNTVRILSDRGHLELWLNGVRQVETTMFNDAWKSLIKGSKFKDMPDFGKSKGGRIALQDHGNQVWFRNIKIRQR